MNKIEREVSDSPSEWLNTYPKPSSLTYYDQVFLNFPIVGPENTFAFLQGMLYHSIISLKQGIELEKDGRDYPTSM